jgi:hypothetical protein
MGLKEIEDLVLYESTCRRDGDSPCLKYLADLIEKAEETRSDKVDEPEPPPGFLGLGECSACGAEIFSIGPENAEEDGTVHCGCLNKKEDEEPVTTADPEPSEKEVEKRACMFAAIYDIDCLWTAYSINARISWRHIARETFRLEHEAVKRVQMQLDQAEQVIVDVANLVEEAGISRDLDVVDMVKALISDANSQSKRLETAIDAAVANAKEAEEQAEKLDYTAMEGYGDCDNCVSVDVNGRDEPCDLCVHPDPNDSERTEDNWRPKAEESSALEPSEVEARAKTLVSVLPGDGSWDSIGNQRRQAWRIVARETFRLEHEAVEKWTAKYLDLREKFDSDGKALLKVAQERDEAIARVKTAEKQIGDLQGEASEAWHQLREATTERDGFQDQRDSSRAMISKLEKKIAILKKDCDNRVSKSVYERSEALVVELQSRLNTVLETAQKCADKALVSPPVVLPVVHKDSIEGAMKRREEFKELNGEEKPPVKHSDR